MTSDEGPTVRDFYLATLELTGKQNSKEMRQAALQRAYAMRSFEIDLYWRRALYFWGFQAAIFAALGFIWKSGSSIDELSAALATLGVLVAFAHTHVSSGSSFWQKNWERHIDLLEDEFEGALYKSVWLQDGKRSYSPSRLNQTLLKIFLSFWIFCFLIVTKIWGWLPQLSQGLQIAFSQFPLSALAPIAALAFGFLWLNSQLTKFGGARVATPWSDESRAIQWAEMSPRPEHGSDSDTLIRRPVPAPARSNPERDAPLREHAK